MSLNIPTSFVRQYSANVDHLVQQKGSLFRDCVRVETGVVGEQAFFDQIGSSAAQKRTTRHADTPIVNVPHSRRRVAMVDYEWADLIDKQDKVRTLIDPQSAYTQNAAWAMMRAEDDEIIAAALGTAYTGKTGSTTQANTNSIAASSAGLTLAKLLSTRETLRAGLVDKSIPLFIACAAKQITDLLNTSQVQSADFNTIKALARGEVDSFMGFTFKETERLETDSSSNRKVIAWAKDGLLLAIGEESGGSIDKRPDKSNAVQVYYSSTIGATRMEEAKVVEILCVES